MKILIISLLTIILLFKAHPSLAQHGLALYPISNELGYRSNLSKVGFWDFTGGYKFSELPFFNIEFARCWRIHRGQYLNYYSGMGITLDGIQPGFIIPLGFEIKPLEHLPNLNVIVETGPKMSFLGSSVLYASFSSKIGVCYHFEKGRPSKSNLYN